MHVYVHCSTICKSICISVIDWIQKMWYTYTMEYYTAIRKEIMSFAATWMKLEAIILSKPTEEQKIKHHMFSLKSGSATFESIQTQRRE